MKLLIISHPDDEILWFNPQDFDKIIIVFSEREDNIRISEARKNVLKRHPLKNKIKALNFSETGYWRQKLRLEDHQNTYQAVKEELTKELQNKDIECIYTHNPWGEYRDHSDHILVNQVVQEITEVPIYCWDGITPQTGRPRFKVKMDIPFYNKVKKIYKEEGAWTWYDNYEPMPTQYYFKL